MADTPKPKTEKTDLTHRFDPAPLYDRYRVRIRVRDECQIDGGTPKDPKIIEAWVKARTGHDDDLTRKQVEEHTDALAETVGLEDATEQVAEKMWCGFKRDDVGPYVEARQVKAMFKESASMLRITVTKLGSKQILQHGFEIKGHNGGPRIHLEGGETGTVEKPIHVKTPQGPRSAITRTDFIMGCELEFQVWVLGTAPQEKRHVGEEDLVRMLTHAQENGLGANRSQGSGKFLVIAFELLGKAELPKSEEQPRKKKAPLKTT